MTAILNKILNTIIFLFAGMLSILLLYVAIAILIAAVLFVFEAHSVIALYTEDIRYFEISNMFQYYLFHSMAMSVYITCGFIIGYSISTAYDKYKEFKCI